MDDFQSKDFLTSNSQRQADKRQRGPQEVPEMLVRDWKLLLYWLISLSCQQNKPPTQQMTMEEEEEGSEATRGLYKETEELFLSKSAPTRQYFSLEKGNVKPLNLPGGLGSTSRKQARTGGGIGEGSGRDEMALYHTFP